jgi:hypothetical protein
MRTRIAGLAALLRVSGTASRAYGVSRASAARRAVWLRRQGAFAFDEALGLGLLDPAVSRGACATYASRHVNMEAQLRLNGRDEPAVINEKLVFQRYCEGIGIRVPPLVAVVDRDGGSWMLPGRALPLAAGGADLLPPAVVVKPSAGYEGAGVRLLHREGDGALREHDGRRTTLDALVAELRAHPEFDTWLVQERLRNDPAVAALGGEDTLHTVRFVTLVGHDGRAEILWTGMRLGIAGGAVDNYGGGAYGNVFCAVDPMSGTLGPVATPRPDGLGIALSHTIPGTHLRAEGAHLPHWEAARELVLRAAPAFLPIRTIGWDIGLTPDGPVAVEANTRWGAAALPGLRAVVARLEAEARR